MQDLLEKIQLLKIIMHLQYLRPKPMTNSYSHGALVEIMTNTNKNYPGLVGQSPRQHRDLSFLLPQLGQPSTRYRQPARDEKCIPFISSCPSQNRIPEKKIHSFQIQRMVGKNDLVTRQNHSTLGPWESKWIFLVLIFHR